MSQSMCLCQVCAGIRRWANGRFYYQIGRVSYVILGDPPWNWDRGRNLKPHLKLVLPERVV